MRTISVRLDDRIHAVLIAYCKRHGLTQADALKVAIERLTHAHCSTPAELAAEFGLIGGFRSGDGGLAQAHSLRVKSRLAAKRERESR
jgi:hypothetical protein